MIEVANSLLEVLPESMVYVTNKDFFWFSMAFTTMMGIFIGSMIWDGDTSQMRKILITLTSYSILIVLVDLSRIIPRIALTLPENRHMTLAGISTILLVTVFYVLGMYIGVLITRHAHHGQHQLQ